jgi:hypothetical protein
MEEMMNPRFRIALWILTIMVLSVAGSGWSAAEAATLNVPSRYNSVAAALAEAVSGDIIEIAPGLYQENNLAVPEGVTLAGTGVKPQDVMIDGGRQGRIMILEGLTETVTIRNLLFMNGLAQGPSTYDQSGGAIFVSNSQVRIENCVFSANNADAHGGAIRLSNSTGEILSSAFYANTSPVGGGGAIDLSYNSSPLVRDCEFLGNRAAWGGALSCRAGSSPRVENSELKSNLAEGSHGFGGGVFADTQSFPDILNSLIVDNQAYFGGGLASWTGGGTNLDYCTVAYNKGWVLEGGLLVVNSSAFVTGSIIAFNKGRGVSVAGLSDITISCTDMNGNSIGDWALPQGDLSSRNGNLNVDPEFCSIQPGHPDRFALASSSPLADNPDGCGVLGARPVSCTGDKALVEIPVASAAIERVLAAPNPFNPQTAISFEISKAQDIKVSIYGVDGRLVRVLADESLPAGAHEMMWMGRDRAGRAVGSGTYFVIVKGREDTKRLKITLLK